MQVFTQSGSEYFAVSLAQLSLVTHRTTSVQMENKHLQKVVGGIVAQYNITNANIGTEEMADGSDGAARKVMAKPAPDPMAGEPTRVEAQVDKQQQQQQPTGTRASQSPTTRSARTAT